MPLAARFHAIRDRVVGAVDRTFAEPVRLVFRKDGSVDPEREAVEVEAVLRAETGDSANLAGGRGQDWNARVAAQKARLALDRASYAGPMPREGDLVKALARPGEPWFAVSRVDDRGHSRLVLELTEA